MFWPEFIFPPINLWSMPKMQADIDYQTKSDHEDIYNKLCDLMLSTPGYNGLNHYEKNAVFAIQHLISKILLNIGDPLENWDLISECVDIVIKSKNE